MEEERWRWKEGGGESGRRGGHREERRTQGGEEVTGSRGGHREERRTQEEWEGEKWDRERE